MDSLLRDVRYALGGLARNPAFSIAAISALALGLGATTAVFSVVYGVLLRPLPYAEPDRLVHIFEAHPGAPAPPGDPQLSNTTFDAWRGRTRSLEDIAPYYTIDMTVGFDEGPVRLRGADVGAGVFTVLRAVPALGRFIAPPENAAGDDAAVVLSDRLWRERFGADPDVVGRTLRVDGRPRTIVGVAQPDFAFPDRSVLLWKPYVDPTKADASIQGGVWLTSAIGRLRADATPAQAAAEGTAVARGEPRPPVLDALYGIGGPVQVYAEAFGRQMTSRVRGMLLVVAASVVFILIVASANAANLFLCRGVTRQREFAVRTALGAGRLRLVRQLLTETAVLAGIAAVAGVGLAHVVVRAAAAVAPRDFPRLDDIRIDGAVLLVSACTTLVTAIVTGLLPAIRGTSAGISASLSAGDGAFAGGFRGRQGRRLRDALLVSESAVAVLLIVGAALFARSFSALVRVDAGYSPDNVVVAQVFPDPAATPARLSRLTGSLLEWLRGDGRVIAAGAGNMIPFSESTSIAMFDMPGPTGAPVRARPYLYRVTPGYAEALGLRLREGRLLRAGDEIRDRVRVVVNEEFARRYLPAGPAAGRTFTGGPGGPALTTEIVGVVGNMLKDGNAGVPVPELYAAIAPSAPIADEIDLVVRTSADPAAMASSIGALVRAVDPTATPGPAMPLAQRVAASVAEPRFAALLFVMFAALAAVLASVGLYSVLSYAVSQRRRELGVRWALGATRGDLAMLVVREGLGVTAVGIALGTAAAAVLSRFVAGLLFAIAPLDPIAYAAPLLLLPVALAASLVPARLPDLRSLLKEP